MAIFNSYVSYYQRVFEMPTRAKPASQEIQSGKKYRRVRSAANAAGSVEHICGEQEIVQATPGGFHKWWHP